MLLLPCSTTGENSIILVGGANTSDNWKITDEATQARRRVVLAGGLVLGMLLGLPMELGRESGRVAGAAGARATSQHSGSDCPCRAVHDAQTPPAAFPQAVQTAGALLLQREIPEVFNVIFAKVCAGLDGGLGCTGAAPFPSNASDHSRPSVAHLARGTAPANPPGPATTYPPPHTQIAASAGVPVILDAGGVTQPIQVDLLSNVSLVSPNETELARLTSGWHGCWTMEWVDGVQGDSVGWPCDSGVRS